MSLRARFGFRDDGKAQCRIVMAGADIDNASLAQIVFDADYAAVRIAYSGSVTYTGSANRTMSTLLTFPDMGYIPLAMIAACPGVNTLAFYQSYLDSSDPGGQRYSLFTGPSAVMACSFMDEVPSQGWSINSVEATVTRTTLRARSTFSYAGKLNYVIFAIPTG
jgi:hypothetical protein